MTAASPPPVAGLDMATLPFTDRLSRLLIFGTSVSASDTDSSTGTGGGLWLATAEYERNPRDCVLVERLTLGNGRQVLPARAAGPDVVAFGRTGCTLTFADPDTVSIGLAPGTWTITLTLPEELPDARLTSWGGRFEPGLPSAPAAAWRVNAATWQQEATRRTGRVSVRVDIADPDGAQFTLGVLPSADAEPAPVSRHATLRAEARQRWAYWFARMPVVPPHLAEAGRTAWWTLAANTLRLRTAPGKSAVVPSKLGYVGHWQWDSYFIATGLRHGDPALAWEQVQIALDHQQPDGMLPDVVHDDGVLANSTALPPADIARLIAHGFTLDGQPVPLTKPPLTAWAVAKVHEVSPDPAFLANCFASIERSQQWWLTASDPDGDGLAEYLHPYSSGLDDSPVFDRGFGIASADLNAYLTLQYDELARIAGWLGRVADQARLADAARAHAARLIERQWAAGSSRFLPLRPSSTTDEPHTATRQPHTVTDLLPLVTGRLPVQVADALAADIADPQTFGGDPAVPTVSRADPAFQADRMWRGPVWINTNYLLIEGLRRHGHTAVAERLNEQTLQLVCASGPFEYFNAATGAPGSRAVPMFSWTAALFLDLATPADRTQ